MMGKRRVTLVLAALAAIGSPPLSATAGEPAWSEKAIKERIDPASLVGMIAGLQLENLAEEGRDLFEARFTTLDGAGRPNATQAIVPTAPRRPAEFAFQRLAGPDANACSSCHNEPVTGGAGGFVANAFVSEGFESANFDTLDAQFSNERGTNHLFGAGLIELLAREMSADLAGLRRAALRQARDAGEPVRAGLSSKGVDFGRITALPDGSVDLTELSGVDDDLVVRPFTQKGVMTSLRQFTVNAMNQHHGMQADERWGTRWTGMADFDGDAHEAELGTGEISALVAFQATLAPPREETPDDEAWAEAASRGRTIFAGLGCESCHRPALPLKSLAFEDPGPVDMAGTLRRGDVEAPATYDLATLEWAKRLPRNDKGEVMVPLFGDLKRHRIADSRTPELGNETLAQRFVERDVFVTAEALGPRRHGALRPPRRHHDAGRGDPRPRG
ncbi:hypothetical protein [Jiella pelagia]|uniref:Di-haem oxidoreductase, peroxidase n=1 Tax=Jiella pelagia TaxID=2986949 RepID=A0ABY7C2D8_9HYPH|nr:hypothetical protein [Jiella pelagia]WAP70029.1 hypothetical protein OH818_07720 [Jiella pelagia]